VDGARFREWRTQARIEQEEAEWLRPLTPEPSRAISLALWESANRLAPQQPSEFTTRLQKVFQRMPRKM